LRSTSCSGDWSRGRAVCLLRTRVGGWLCHTLALIGVPPLRDVFDLEPIEPKYWGMLAAMPPLFLLAEETCKLLVRARRRHGR
jgi:hypothetical protein